LYTAAYQDRINQDAAILRAKRAADDQLKQQTQQARDKRSAGEKLTLTESELLAKADQEEAKRKERAAAAELHLPPSQPSCGLLGCVSSPFLRAKLGDRVVGRPVSEAVGIAGAPTASVAVGNITAPHAARRLLALCLRGNRIRAGQPDRRISLRGKLLIARRQGGETLAPSIHPQAKRLKSQRREPSAPPTAHRCRTDGQAG
jgi:hypothetical protein